MKDFQSILKPILPQRIIAFVFQLLSIVLSLVQPLLIGRLFDEINTNLSASSFQTISRLIYLLIAVSVSDFVVYYLKDYLFSKALYNGVNLMRGHILSLALHQPISVLEKNNIGDKLNKILNDSEFYATYKIHQLPNAIIVFIRIILIYIILLSMSVELTGLIFVIFVIYLLLYLIINKKIQPAITEELEEYSKVINQAQETITGFEAIKINVKEEYFEKRFVRGLDKYLEKKVKVQRYSSLDNSLITFFYSIIPISILSAGAYLILNNQITLGVLFAIYSYTHWIIEPVFILAKLNKFRQQAIVSFPRLKSFINESASHEPQGKLANNFDSIDSLILKNVDFAYDPSKPIIQDLSLTIKKGDRIAITGESGIGKSTLAKLLLGIIQPDTGEVQVNGKSLSSLDLKDYLEKCSYMPQEIFLFSESLEENISFGEGSLDLSETIFEKLRLQEILDRKLTDVNELSGGERQRIGMARTLHQKPSLIIYDEPTSALDQDMEESIIEAMDEYLIDHPCIFIVITHRKPILRICNRELHIDSSAHANLFDLDA